MIKSKLFWAAIIGNALDHFDTALYGLLAPVLAPLFFPSSSATLSLIYTYLLMAISLSAKPLGSLFFGNLAVKKSPKQALSLSLLGIGLSTGAIGLLPTAHTAPLLAPLFLLVSRLTQGFFAAGEKLVGNLYLIEMTPEHKRGWVNSAFHSFCVVGIFLASLSATQVVSSSAPQTLWRLPFLVGSLTALIGLFVRRHIPDTRIPSTATSAKKIRDPFLRTLFASSLTQVTYAVPFLFFNHFIPLITEITLTQMLTTNSLFLILDLLLLPVFGALSDRYSATRWMSTSALLLGLTAIPLFLLLPKAQLATVIAIRLWIVLLGLAFLAPLQRWLFSIYERDHCYRYSGLGSAFGEIIIGKGTPAICLTLWHTFHSPIAPASYICLIALLAAVSVGSSSRLQARALPQTGQS